MDHFSLAAPPLPREAHTLSARYIDSDRPEVRAFAEEAAGGAASAVDRAVRLFYAVRDRWRYDPFSICLQPDAFRASAIVTGGPTYCVPKAILLAAAARALGIPSGLGLADVRNHLTSNKLRARMGGNETFVDHGYAARYLENRWVKAAPAFNRELCDRFDVRPTEFDGRADALFQEFDARDRRHMEYVQDHGVWSDVPVDRIIADFSRAYPADFFLGVSAGFEPDAAGIKRLRAGS